MYSWGSLKNKRGFKHKSNHIINKETMSSLCGQFKPDLTERSELVYRKMVEVFTSNRCKRCMQITKFLNIRLEDL
jgi:hypothetical protein